jgi:uncharacterized protein (TIGR03000 family)
MFKRWVPRIAVLALVVVALLCTPGLVQAQRYGGYWGGGWGGWGSGWGGARFYDGRGYYGNWGYHWPRYYGFYGSSWPYSGYYGSYWPYSGYYVSSWPYSGYYGSSWPYYGYYGFAPSDVAMSYYWDSPPSSSSVPSYYDSGNPSMNDRPATTNYSYGSSQQTEEKKRVLVDVKVPKADAEIWFEGKKTNQTGTARQFSSPLLTPGRDYTYAIRARWVEDGKEVNRTRRVDVHAGDHVTVDFTRPE